MIMIFPMAGLSQRFVNAGYEIPKYMLPLHHKSVFYYAVEGFRKYFSEWNFLFIFRDIAHTSSFIAQECKKLGLKKYECVELSDPTLGQAHTVMLGLEKIRAAEEDLLIFNIDTFRPNFVLPKELDFSVIDGYLEVFEAEGEQWSFVLPSSDNYVAKTAEKERISTLCSSGLYYFKSLKDFQRIFNMMNQMKDLSKNELYIAPMYNYLIREGKNIRYHKISLEDIVFCGTPQEYEKLKSKEQK